MNTQLPDRHAFSTARTAFPLSVVLAVAAATTGVALQSIAASEPPAARPAVVTATSGSVIAIDPRDSQVALIDELSFPGGTVKQYVEAIESAIKPLPLNVMFYDQADKVLVGSIRLRSVSVGTAMRMLNSEIANNSVTVQYAEGKVPGDQGVYFLRGQMNAVDANLLRSLTTRVFSLREWTVAESPDAAPLADSRRAAALGAIEQGLSFGLESNPGPYFKPIVRYHPESGLLFVRASGQDQDIAESIVRKLEQSFRDADNAKKDQDANESQRVKIQALQKEVDEFRAKVQAAKAPSPVSESLPVRADIRGQVLKATREVAGGYGSVFGRLEISEGPTGIELRGPVDLVHHALCAARAASKVLGDDSGDKVFPPSPR